MTGTCPLKLFDVGRFDSTALLTFILLVLTPVLAIFLFRARKEMNHLKRAIKYMQFNAYSLFAILLAFMLLLPQLPALKFYYPQTILELQDPAAIFRYFKYYHAAIVKTVDVLNCFLFLFCVWFLTAFLVMLRAISKELEKKEEKS